MKPLIGLLIFGLAPLPAAAPLGKVTPLPEPCAGGGPAGATCRQVTVSCPGLRDVKARLRIVEAAPGIALRGTVVLGSGGNGAGFYAGAEPALGLVRELAGMGLTVVDRAWEGGWVTQEGGLKPEACRYATLLTWIHQAIHQGGKFVATGNSGGSAEIGYALTTYGRGDILDAAIPTSGPPVARLDYVCAAQASAEWEELCAKIVPAGQMACKPGCMLGPGNGVCRQTGPQPTAAQLAADSVVHPEAVLHYPRTRVLFLFGKLDCDEPVPAGLTWATRITSARLIHFVPNTPHAILSTTEGRAALRRAVEMAAGGGGQAAAAPAGQAPNAAQQEFRRRTMEALTDPQRAHMQASGRVDRQQWIAAHPARPSTGLVPLTELGAGQYKGEPGGLYPGGASTPPAAHREAGLRMAARIQPLDRDGRPAPDGRIVLLSIGMSNTTMKFQTFQKLAAGDRSLHPRLVLVDGAQGGQVAWITANPKTPFWDVVAERLAAAGVTARQVQAAWLLQANPGPNRPFPAEAKELQENLVDTLHAMRDKFPNLQVTFLSSRTYAGYATTPLNPEPHAYETGFAVKWLVAGQIAGKPELNFDAAWGPVRAPWVAWGPYVWADGVKPNRDGLAYPRDDYGDDGTHPAPGGRSKVAERLLQFLKTDPVATPWFLAK